jgi:hypothetical protein
VELIGPYLIGCVLLIVAGAMKTARPDDTARAVATMVPKSLRPLIGFRALRSVIRIVSVGEAGLGLVALVAPRPLTAALVGTSYLAFAGVVAYARSKGGALASCGCFGTPDTPATYTHVVMDLLLATSALISAWTGPRAGWIMTVLARQPLRGAPLLLLTVAGTAMTYLTLSALARLRAVRLAIDSSDPVR